MTTPPPRSTKRPAKFMAEFTGNQVTDDRARRASAHLIHWAQKLQIDVNCAKSWDHLASLIADRMDRKCILCDLEAGFLGIWLPTDPSLFDDAGAIIYIHCGDHSISQVEAKIAHKHARTS